MNHRDWLTEVELVHGSWMCEYVRALIAGSAKGLDWEDVYQAVWVRIASYAGTLRLKRNLGACLNVVARREVRLQRKRYYGGETRHLVRRCRGYARDEVRVFRVHGVRSKFRSVPQDHRGREVWNGVILPAPADPREVCAAREAVALAFERVPPVDRGKFSSVVRALAEVA